MEAGLLPSEAAALLELDTLLELLDPQHELVLLMGDFNAHTSPFTPIVEGQLPRMSTNTVLNPHSHGLLSLLM